MAITATGTFFADGSNELAALEVISANAGDLITVATLVTSATATITAMANGTADGGGWTKRVSYVGLGSTTIDLWTARVGTPGTDNVDLTWSGVTGAFVILARRCFTAGLGASTVWALDGTASGQDNASDTTCEYPSKTATGSGELYVGYGFGSSQAVNAGTTPGVVYSSDGFDNMFVHHVSASGTLAPVATNAGATTTASLGALFTATAPGSAIVPPPTLRMAARGRASLY